MSNHGYTRPENHVVVIFGATGDLAKRKLLPGWFHLYAAGLLPKEFRLIGSSPPSSAMTDEQFRAARPAVVRRLLHHQARRSALAGLRAEPVVRGRRAGQHRRPGAAVQRAEKEIGGTPGRLYHLAIPPVAFTSVVGMLGESGLARGARIIIEKPFGTDLDSARKLNQAVHAVFDESQVFRIDHFLGKESVDNILAFRFANGLFEPVWNRSHIRYVQIDVPETLTIEGRAAFYDATGAYRDMVVTHLFQVLAFVAMEPPVSLSAGPLRDEKLKVYQSLRPIDVRHVGARAVRGVPRRAGGRGRFADRDDGRGAGRGGKLALARSAVLPALGKGHGRQRQVVTLGFHEPPTRMFHVHRRDIPTGRMNEIVIDFADPGSITTEFLAKVPGPELSLGHATMTFRYEDSFVQANALEGYEHLILQAMIGDQSLFTRSDGIERLWEISEPLLEKPPPVEPYAVGSWGPDSVNRMIEPYHWHLSEH